MSVAIAQALLVALAVYAVAGTIVAVPLVILGIGRIDPAARSAPWTFRALVFPGVVAFWPLLLARWVKAGGRR